MPHIAHGGGIDSTLLFALLAEQFNDDFHIYHMNYGHLAANAELKAIEKQIDYIEARFNRNVVLHRLQVNIPKVGLLFTGNLNESPEIPNRNKLILDAISVYTRTVWFGAEPTPPNKLPMEDCTASFFRLYCQNWTETHNIPFNVMTPFLYNTYDQYVDILRRSIFGDRYMMMSYAMTCWTPTNEETFIPDMHCGRCAHCEKYSKLYGRKWS